MFVEGITAASAYRIGVLENIIVDTVYIPLLCCAGAFYTCKCYNADIGIDCVSEVYIINGALTVGIIIAYIAGTI